MKRKLALLLSIVMAAGMLTACGSDGVEKKTDNAAGQEEQDETAAAPNEVESDETLTVVLAGEPEGMTRLAGNNDVGLYINPSFGHLLSYNSETKEIESGIADYEIIDDTHYRFTIKDEVVFSDGTPVTTEDVQYTMQCYKDANVQAISSFDVENFVVEDDQNIIIALENYERGWEYDLTSELPIFSKRSIDEIGVENTAMQAPISCGKYTVNEWKHGQYILYERNENYWDDSYTGYFKYIKMMFVPDAASRVLAVRSGDADVANEVSITDYTSLKGDATVSASAYPTGKVVNLLFNCQKMTDEKAREAVAHAVNAENVNSVLNLGEGKVVQGLFDPEFQYYAPVYEEEHAEYDVELAKEMWQKTDYAKSGIPLKLICLQSYKNAAAVVQEDLRQSGIEVEVNVMDQMAYLETSRSGDYDMQISNSLAIIPRNTTYAQINPSQIGQAANSIRYETKELSAAIEKAESSDDTEAKEGYEEIQKIVFDNYCLVGLCDTEAYCVYNKDIEGFTVGSILNRVDFTMMYREQ